MSSTPGDAALVDAALRTLKPDWAGTPVSRLDYLPGGYTNRNYRIEIGGGVYALRVVHRPAPGTDGFRSDHRDLQMIEDRYLRIAAAPDVVAHDLDSGHLLTRWIDGRLLAQAPPTPQEGGTYLAALHRQIPTGVRRYDHRREVAGMLRRAGEIDPLVLQCFRDLAWIPTRRRGCHNDLNPWNIIRTAHSAPGEHFRTLDWETAGDNDPLFDLAGLCWGLDWDETGMRDCLGAYQAAGGEVETDDDRVADTMRAFLIREYAWAVAQIADGNDREEIREQARTTRDALVGGR